jgi:hypothetical protein
VNEDIMAERELPPWEEILDRARALGWVCFEMTFENGTKLEYPLYPNWRELGTKTIEVDMRNLPGRP